MATLEERYKSKENQENWKKLIVEGNCECDENDTVELVDAMADKGEEIINMCQICNKERLPSKDEEPCSYCGKLPCRCVQNNNEVDEYRGN